MFFFPFFFCFLPLRTKIRQGTGFSESDVSDIMNESDSTPTSPKATVEAIILVNGVQPELQLTQKESERDSKSLHNNFIQLNC